LKYIVEEPIVHDAFTHLIMFMEMYSLVTDVVAVYIEALFFCDFFLDM